MVFKFGELLSSNLGVYAVKTRNFAAVRPQFDDNLHSTRWRLQTEWKIVILILQSNRQSFLYTFAEIQFSDPGV